MQLETSANKQGGQNNRKSLNTTAQTNVSLLIQKTMTNNDLLLSCVPKNIQFTIMLEEKVVNSHI